MRILFVSAVLLCFGARASAQDPDRVFVDGIEDCSMMLDGDADRLIDCDEVFRYQTRPEVADTDDDGFKDGEEVLGPIPAAGHPLLDMRALGANPRKKTIFLEIDWVDDSTDSWDGWHCAPHSHRPTALEVQDLIAAYADAPVPVAAGAVAGIQLIVDFGQGGAFTGGNIVAIPNGVIPDDTITAAFQAYKTQNFVPNRRGYFHYMISAHQYTTFPQSSGFADIGGDDIIVSLFCGAHEGKQQMTTMMHELGHNLGLLHGGNTGCNFKSNYNSIMNYRYQWPGVDANCDVNGDHVYTYSPGDRVTIDEHHVNEYLGVCGLGWQLDWNFNGMIQPDIELNTNDYGNATKETSECGGTLTVLSDFDDWAHVNLKVLPTPVSGGGAELPTKGVECAPPPTSKRFVFGSRS